MPLPLLALLSIVGFSPGVSHSGTLAGGWYLEDTSTDERRAFSQPFSQKPEDTQVTLGIKSPGLMDLVDFYLVISSNGESAGCEYTVREIVIDSVTFTVMSTTHSSDVSQITTKTDDEQNRLWSAFRKGQNLSLKLHQSCSGQTGPSSEVSTFIFSLKGSNAAYKFAANQEATDVRIEEKVKIQKQKTIPVYEGVNKKKQEESVYPSIILIIIAVFIVILAVRFFSRQPGPSSKGAILKSGSEGLDPIIRDHLRDWRDINKAPNDSQVAPKARRVHISESEQLISDFPNYKVEHVIDGDTVIVSRFRNKITIRLDSIDCPEDGQEWGNYATAGLIKLIGGKHVHVEEHTIDHYGRTVATLYVHLSETSEWLNVNERMITLGHAWVMRRYYKHLPEHRRDKLNRLERWARSKKVGLWQLPNPIPPWDWRRGSS